jgi:hypothetical protein
MDLINGNDPIASWWLAVGVVALVTLVVAVLLALVIRTASSINDEVATIWANGQRVANNTIHIAALYKTRDYTKGILGHAGDILRHSQAIRDHAIDTSSGPKSILQKVN